SFSSSCAQLDLHSFPTRRSSDLRAEGGISDYRSIRFMRMFLSKFSENTVLRFGTMELIRGDYRRFEKTLDEVTFEDPTNDETLLDRKSTRLNSSHVKISYAVFCL